MLALTPILNAVLMILAIVVMFNIIIFVHELGHFWAAKWRGLQIDRFQIWFGKPIWKKTINGVQYGLGWIPAGGFVALPQMAPMEAIEGGEKPEQPLPPISPMDKIIVAFAGPLFSMLLALVSAVLVWQAGKPKDFIHTQIIGYVEEGMPGHKAGLQAGDKIIAINGEPVNGYAGTLDSIRERIVLSRGDTITFTVERPGVDEPLELTTGFEIPESKWFQRRGLRNVGLGKAGPAVIAKIYPNSPAADAGLKQGERIASVDGQTLYSPAFLSKYLEDNGWKTVILSIEATDGTLREVSLTPEKPLKPSGVNPMLGVLWDQSAGVDVELVKPGPLEQVGESLMMMWTTITSVASPQSNIGIDHLAGPVGIGSVMYDFLSMEDGWRRILAFMVLFNVNLAVLNMLPFPVLDGGHITLALLEKLAGKPVQAKPLEIIQTICALALISLMLFVTSKDIGDRFFGHGGQTEVQFPD